MQKSLRLWKELDDSFAAFLLNTLPLAVLLVTNGVRVRGLNEAAVRFLGISSEEVYLQKCGDVLKCINASSPEGCGASPRCLRCILRKSVLDALDGQIVSRSKGNFDLIKDGEINRLTLLITAAPIQYKNSRMVIVLIEDVSLVTQLKGLIPICSACHRIRDDNGEWMKLERYLMDHSEAELTHDYCPTCIEKMLVIRAICKE